MDTETALYVERVAGALSSRIGELSEAILRNARQDADDSHRLAELGELTAKLGADVLELGRQVNVLAALIAPPVDTNLYRYHPATAECDGVYSGGRPSSGHCPGCGRAASIVLILSNENGGTDAG